MHASVCWEIYGVCRSQGDQMGTPTGDGFCNRTRPAGASCWLACHSSLFDPRRRRGRILRDVPRPDANSGARSAARSPLLIRVDLARAERNGASAAWRIDRMSRGSCYPSIEKACFCDRDGRPEGRRRRTLLSAAPFMTAWPRWARVAQKESPLKSVEEYKDYCTELVHVQW
jgi:hypothetical protein